MLEAPDVFPMKTEIVTVLSTNNFGISPQNPRSYWKSYCHAIYEMALSPI